MKVSLGRRKLLTGSAKIAGLALGARAASPSVQAGPPPTPSPTLPGATPLSNPIENLFQARGFDVVVVGSGYGGSVLSARLKAKFPARSLAILEKGKEWVPGTFPKSLAQAARQSTLTNPLGLYEFHLMSDMDIFQGSGLGGTSLVNANVAIEPDPELWTQPEWPKSLARDFSSGKMAEYYRRARAILQPEAYPGPNGNWPELKKDEALREGALATGALYRQVDITVNFSRSASQTNAAGVRQIPCQLCGDCVTGCNYGSKNTLNQNYLPLAKGLGANIFTQVGVEFIRELENDPEGYRYAVVYLHRTEKGALTRGEVKARNVVVSAGVVGTCKILLRSKALGALTLSDALGSRVSSNGDTLGFAIATDRQTNIGGHGLKPRPKNRGVAGPTMEAAAVYSEGRDLKDRFVIEHGAIPESLTGALELFTAVQNPEGVADPLNRSMVYLGCGHDDASGRLSLGKNGKLKMTWPKLRDQKIFQDIKSAMKAHAKALGGTFSSPDVRRRPITVHPLGGCVMADSADLGAIDSRGRAYRDSQGTRVHTGLYVADGSIVPTSIGVNPFLTITALSERIADLISEEDL